MKVQIAVAVASVITALATLGLAYVTLRLARETRTMADTNREMVEANREMVGINKATLEEIKTEREGRERPRVIVYVDYDQLPMLYLVVENAGGSTAARVSFLFKGSGRLRPAMKRYDVEAFDLTQELRMFKGGYGIRLLPAGEKLSIWWGHAEDVARTFRYNDPGLEVEVYYSSLTTEPHPIKDRDYRETFFLNPVDVWTANQTALGLRPPSLNRLVYPIIKAAERITKAIDTHGFVKTKTVADVQHDRAARWREATEPTGAARPWWRRLFG